MWIAHASGMPKTFSPHPISNEAASERFRHASGHVRHTRAVMHVGIANPRWRRKRSRHSRRMRNPLFYVPGKRPIPRGSTATVQLWTMYNVDNGYINPSKSQQSKTTLHTHTMGYIKCSIVTLPSGFTSSSKRTSCRVRPWKKDGDRCDVWSWHNWWIAQTQ